MDCLLPIEIRREMENAFHADLSSVRVGESVLPLLIDAEAFAYGEQIFFAPGRFRPCEERGRGILAHELTHVLQQRLGCMDSAADKSRREELESEALELGKIAARGGRVRVSRGRPGAAATPAVQCIKTQFEGIPALELLQILDQEIDWLVSNHAFRLRIRSDNTYVMNSGDRWLGASGHLSITKSTWSQRNTWVPCKLLVGSEGTEMEVSGSGAFTERLEFPSESGSKKDLNYKQIATQIQGLGLAQSTQAEGILIRMRGRPHVPTAGKATFLNAMVALLFGLEASRNKATLATTLMLLDLVRCGKMYGSKGNKPFTLSGAFNSSHGYTWDDGEYGGGSLYGGKHPMAVHGTGSGNLGARYAMTSDPSDVSLQQEFAELNQKHAVPRREVSLLIHWLESMIPAGSTATFDKAWVSAKIRWRLRLGYLEKGPAILAVLPGKPRKNGGPKVRLTYEGVVYYVKKNGYVVGNYHHIDPRCKLIPGQTGYTLGRTDSDDDIDRLRLTRCPYCWTHISGVFEGAH